MYNLLAYFIYLFLVLVVIIFVGGFLFRNGKFFLKEIFQNQKTTQAISVFLYAGYCLINTGGAFFCLQKIENFNSYLSSLEYVTTNIGSLLVLLALLHFFNMLILPILKKTLQSNFQK